MKDARPVETVLFCSAAPSRGVVRDAAHTQHVLVEHRCGAVSDWTSRLVAEVLEDVEQLNQALRRRWTGLGIGGEDGRSGEPRVLLRSVFVDDKHGSVRLVVDLHQQSGRPELMPAHVVADWLHDGRGWYRGQGVSVCVRVRPVWFQSDGYFDLADEWYRDAWGREDGG